jgi:hypothetical protein
MLVLEKDHFLVKHPGCLKHYSCVGGQEAAFSKSGFRIQTNNLTCLGQITAGSTTSIIVYSFGEP